MSQFVRKRSIFAFYAMSLLVFGTSLYGQGDYERGISYYKQKQYSKAAAEFEEILGENPDYESGYRIIGDCYLKLKQYEKAAKAFDRAIELDKSRFASHYGAAIARFNLKGYREAIAVLIRAEGLARAPRERYQLFRTRGAAYYKLGRFKEAVADLSKAVAIQRGRFQDAFQLGVAYFQIGDLPNALKFLDQAVALDPSSVEAKKFRARVSYQEGVGALSQQSFLLAAQHFNRVILDNPEDGEAWFNLGLAQLFVKKLSEAEQAFQRSAQLLPDNWRPHDRLGYIYEVEKDYRKSLASYKKAYELNQDSRISESVERIQERIRRQNN